jgi:hypothetical protein
MVVIFIKAQKKIIIQEIKMRTLYIMCEEPSENRYTGEWNEHLPVLFSNVFKKNKIKAEVIQIDGEDLHSTSPRENNIWKSTQLINLLNQQIKDGDVILYTDAWNPTILQVKYFLALQNINVKIVGMWHAGNYDPQDLLGRVMGDSTWIKETERAIFNAIDSNVFSTEFHSDMFLENLLGLSNKAKASFKHFCSKGVVVSGFPFEYLQNSLTKDLINENYKKGIKKNKIIFPHKIMDGKQPAIFRDLATSMPEFEFVFCKEKNLTKKEYHNLVAESILCWSANLQETYGIGMIESTFLNTIPLCPNRLSYSEMYHKDFLYPEAWTKDFDSYLQNKDKIIGKIRDLTNSYKKNPKKMLASLAEQQNKLQHFISSKNMLECVLNYLEQ